MRIRIVEFDFSSIIEEHWKRSYAGACKIFRHYNILEPTFKEYVLGISQVLNYSEYYQGYGIYKEKKKLRERYERGYIGSNVNIKIFEDVLDAFQMISREYVELKIVSQSKNGFASSLIEATGIGEFLTGKYFHVKDKRECLAETLFYRNLEPRACVMVCGTVPDIVSAKEVGVVTVAMLHEGVPRDLYENVEADYIASNWIDIAKYIIEFK